MYIERIFLYNSEIWTLTKSHENTIDFIQRRLLRTFIYIDWPTTISNQRLYERTKWSITIFKGRLTCFAHLRLPVETPAQKALKCFIKSAKKPIGRPKTTWLNTVIRDIRENSEIDLTQDLTPNIDRLKVICSDRDIWHKDVDAMTMKLNMRY